MKFQHNELCASATEKRRMCTVATTEDGFKDCLIFFHLGKKNQKKTYEVVCVDVFFCIRTPYVVLDVCNNVNKSQNQWF